MEITLDKVKQAIVTALDALVGNRLDYLALYTAKVIAQNGDGTFELQPDDARVPGMSKVPLRVGIPGATVTVPAGGSVLLGWSNGDPQRPYATLWTQGASCTQLNLDASTIVLNGGTHAVGRVGDAVQVTVPAGTFLVSASGGVLNPSPVNVNGTIQAGAAGVKA